MNTIQLNMMNLKKLLLTYCKGLKIEDILDESSRNMEEINQLNDILIDINNEIYQVKSKIDNATNALLENIDKRIRNALNEKLIHLYNSAETLEFKKKKIEQDLFNKSVIRKDFINSIESINSFYEIIDNKEGDDLIKSRIRIRNKLRELIKAIVIYPVGHTNKSIESQISFIKDRYPKLDDSTIEFWRTFLETMKYNVKYQKYVVIFNSGVMIRISPHFENPLTFEFDENQGILLSRSDKNIKYEWKRDPDGIYRLTNDFDEMLEEYINK